MEGEEIEIVQAVDTDGDDASDEDNNSDSDDEDLRESYLTAVRYHSKCSKKELKRLLKSNDPQDQKVLNKIVTNILTCDNDEAFYYLLTKGYKLDTFDEKGETIYHRAYYQNSLSILSLMFGWEFDKSNYDDHVDDNGLSYLHIASFTGTEKSVNDYLKSNFNINAQYRCNFDAYRYTVETYRDGFTPLHFAVINYKSEKIVRMLLDNGADVGAVDCSNRTPLHIACRTYETPGYINDSIETYSSIDAMATLVEYKSDVNARDNEGNTPLLSILPSDFGDFETTRGLGFIESIPVLEIKKKLKYLLLQKEVDVTASNKNGDNVLHLIVMNLDYWRCSSTYSELSFDFDVDHGDMIKQIFQVGSRIDVNARNSKGETPLKLAVSFMSSKIVKILLEHGADLSNIEFDYQDLSCFKYPKIVPDLDAVQNLISMIDLLVNNDWELTFEGNLAIMKFLVHDVDDCQCRSLLDVLHLGSLKHIDHILNKKINALSDNSGTDKNQIVIDTKQFLLTKLIVGPAKDIEILHSLLVAINKLSVKITVEGDQSLAEIIVEKARMQFIELQSNFTLNDVLTEHPNDIYFLVKNYDFQKIAKSFPVYENVIKGHIAKALIRHYLENSAYAYLKKLSFAYLPYTCCKRILYYSRNEDILNVCLAAVLSDF